jgi:hypothetical protein
VNNFLEANSMNPLVGCVITSTNQYLELNNACLSAGEGVGAGVRFAKVELTEGIPAPIVGRRVVCMGDLNWGKPYGGVHMTKATWMYTNDDDEITMARTLGGIETAIAGLNLLHETASAEELPVLEATARHLVEALKCLLGDD